jgi:hypothetical protein
MYPGTASSGHATNTQGEPLRPAELNNTANANAALQIKTNWNFPQRHADYEMVSPIANAICKSSYSTRLDYQYLVEHFEAMYGHLSSDRHQVVF